MVNGDLSYRHVWLYVIISKFNYHELFTFHIDKHARFNSQWKLFKSFFFSFATLPWFIPLHLRPLWVYVRTIRRETILQWLYNIVINKTRSAPSFFSSHSLSRARFSSKCKCRSTLNYFSRFVLYYFFSNSSSTQWLVINCVQKHEDISWEEKNYAHSII